MKCTPSPTADIKMEAMPGAGRGWVGVRVEQVRVESKWRYVGIERNKSKGMRNVAATDVSTQQRQVLSN